MPRGGKRIGAGRKKSHDPTITIRVPLSMKETVKYWIKEGYPTDIYNKNNQEKIGVSLSVLKKALTMKANAGGKIKNEIRQVINILEHLET